MKRLLKKYKYGQKGFTLVELLVVVAILGVITAVALPNVGKFIGKGKSESYETELHNVQTALVALLSDSDGYSLTSVGVPAGTVTDFSTVTATKGAATLTLDTYMVGLEGGTSTQIKGVSYSFTTNGGVTQSHP